VTRHKGQIQALKFKREVAIVPINHQEIIEDMEAHIRECGCVWEEWCVGTAKDSRGPLFQRHREADLGDGLTYREAYTTDAAQAVVAHLVNDRGLEPHRDAATGAERRSAPQEPGKIVFVCRETAANAVAGSELPTFHKLAA
jgi:hypothetical protein